MAMRKDIEIEKTSYGYKVTSNYGEVEEGFFNSKKEAQKFIKTELMSGVSPQELHKFLTGKYE